MTIPAAWAAPLLHGYSLGRLPDGRHEATRGGRVIRGLSWLDILVQAGVDTSDVIASAKVRIGVTGSSGKGSTVAMIGAALTAAGLDVVTSTGDPFTGWRTSHRYAPTGRAVPGLDALVFEAHGVALPTTIPLTVSVITSIHQDHLQTLGPTLHDVARNKTRISQPGVPLVLGPVSSDLRHIIEQSAAGPAIGALDGCLLDHGAGDFDFTTPRARYRARLGLHGGHQRLNAAVACRVLELLDVAPTAIVAGLEAARHPGRIEHITLPGGQRRVILDFAKHGPACAGLADYLVTAGLAPLPIYIYLRRTWHRDAMIAALAPVATGIHLLQLDPWGTRRAGWTQDDLRRVRRAAPHVPVDRVETVGTHDGPIALVCFGPTRC